MKKFYAVVGNPPYQIEARGGNNNDTPIYHLFYDAAYQIAGKVELISPARFLFRAGGTPSAWNEKMLKDKHVKVLEYVAKSNEVFPDTEIKGGVAVVYRDVEKDYGPIGVFSRFEIMNKVLKKVNGFNYLSLSTIVSNRGLYRYSDLAYKEQKKELAKTADPRIAPSSFDRMPSLFTVEKPNDGHQYVRILGRTNQGREYRYFRSDYIKPVSNLDHYKVIISKASGSGEFGEALSSPVIGQPGIAFTETYISIGDFDTLDEAEALEKYIKTKFVRALLSTLKVTQNIAKPVWEYVPLQDFTSSSDIDWSKSVPEIDQQLYRKYGLDTDEIEFIESHVKEMN